jgi:hypothetical protein
MKKMKKTKTSTSVALSPRADPSRQFCSSPSRPGRSWERESESESEPETLDNEKNDPTYCPFKRRLSSRKSKGIRKPLFPG